MKIKSSVLQLSILVAVLVGILLLSFITLNHTHVFFRLKSENILVQLQENEASFFSNEPSLDPSDVSIKEYGFRGGFQKLTSTINTKQGDLQKIGLIGAISEKETHTLYLRDNKNPLVLVGDAKLFGSVKIPSSGIKAGVISGRYYQGEQLVYGNMSASSSNLPSLENGYTNYIKKIQDISTAQNAEQANKGKDLKNSFISKEQIVFSNRKMSVYETAIGNIRYQSEQAIIVRKEASLTDVLLVAPIIKVEKGFKGRIHLIAQDSIVIEENVSLSFPSSLVVYPPTNAERSSAILIAENTEINGTVIYLDNNQKDRSSNIKIEKEAVVTGGIYCEGYLEHYGVIYGNVYTSYFLTKASGSSYINHLMDGKICPLKDKKSLVHLPLQKSSKRTVQWLY